MTKAINAFCFAWILSYIALALTAMLLFLPGIMSPSELRPIFKPAIDFVPIFSFAFAVYTYIKEINKGD